MAEINRDEPPSDQPDPQRHGVDATDAPGPEGSAGGAAGAGEVVSTDDIVLLRRRIRRFTEEMGFGLADATRIVTASSELMRNISVYAGQGEVRWRKVVEHDRAGIELVFEDQGPGIEDLERALEPGVGSGRSLGMGLPGSRRLMDEMEIESEPGQGSRITVRKWLSTSRRGRGA